MSGIWEPAERFERYRGQVFPGPGHYTSKIDATRPTEQFKVPKLNNKCNSYRK